MIENMHSSENVHVFRLSHKPSCYLVADDPTDRDETHCSCGALGSTYGTDYFPGKNVITTDGATWYAQVFQRGYFELYSLGATITPTETFRSLYLATAGNTPDTSSNFSDLTTVVTGSEAAVETTYPITNDTGDSDNTGDGVNVVTWQFNYAAGVATDTGIIQLGISRVGASGSNPLLNHAAVTSFDKTATDTLKVIVNHTFQDPSA